ncbi:hypothetical protein [Ferrovibrio sp.]|uniref:DODA-type extradiol aromatic ring-opening family dioxygenase n=1 Tax=Ferrovibrio sp. TaxID=1917215 RepID=UPI0035ADBB8B
MADIAFAAGIPHAPAVVGLFDKAPDDSRKVISASFQSVGNALLSARPDVLIVFANDHITNSRITAYPDFLIAASPQHSGPHEWFKPWIGCRDYTIKGSPDVAKALFKGMTKRGVRMNISDAGLNFDDNISVPVVMTDLDTSGIPIVPVLQNCTVPPYPDHHRCYEIGRQIADFIHKDLPAGMRVGLLASGGLSHEPGGKRYYKIDEEFDQIFLEISASGDHERLLSEITVSRMEQAGLGGTSELLVWHLVMGAIGQCRGTSFGYTGWPGLRCGIGAVLWNLKDRH